MGGFYEQKDFDHHKYSETERVEAVVVAFEGVTLL